jgi:hypothetical protein
MQNLDRQIAYFRKCADDAPTKGAALVAFGMSAGMTLARAELSQTLDESAEMIARWLATGLASGPENEVFRIRDMDKWIADVRRGLDLVLRKR